MNLFWIWFWLMVGNVSYQFLALSIGLTLSSEAASKPSRSLAFGLSARCSHSHSLNTTGD